jgi:hypothetical protein
MSFETATEAGRIVDNPGLAVWMGKVAAAVNTLNQTLGLSGTDIDLFVSDGTYSTSLYRPGTGKFRMDVTAGGYDAYNQVAVTAATNAAFTDEATTGTNETTVSGAATNSGTDLTTWSVRMNGNNVIDARRTSVAPKLGFYGATPVVQAAHPTTLADVITLLTNLGICA